MLNLERSSAALLIIAFLMVVAVGCLALLLAMLVVVVVVLLMLEFAVECEAEEIEVDEADDRGGTMAALVPVTFVESLWSVFA